MRNVIRAMCGATLALIAMAAMAVTNADIVKMKRAGLDEATIMAAVRGASSAKFDTSPDGLIKLKRSGVSDEVIQAIIAKQSGGASASGRSGAGSGTITYSAVADSRVLPPMSNVSAGNEYYTRYTSRYERGEHSVVNYLRGELLPINTKVKLVKLKRGSFVLKRLDTGATIKVENEKKYTNRDTNQLANEMLSVQPTNINLYGTKMADAIRGGTPRLGMTKTQVLLARGYPPSHETPSLNQSEWKYWSSRFITRTFVFNGNVLSQGRGLH